MISKQKKQDAVAAVREEAKQYPVVGVASIASLPASSFNLIRKKTAGQVEIAFARHTLLKRALEDGKPESKELLGYLANGGVLVFSKLSAFKLYKLFRQNQSKALAKPGQIAPADIVIPAGETNLAPGPVLTELKQAKIDAKIQGAKVVIVRDAVVARKCEPISEQAAKILAKLGIQPVEIGIDVQAVWEGGLVYKKEVLDVDADAYLEELKGAHAMAVNLAVFAGIMNGTTAQIIVAKAARQATALQKLVESKSGAGPQASQPEAAAVPAESGANGAEDSAVGAPAEAKS